MCNGDRDDKVDKPLKIAIDGSDGRADCRNESNPSNTFLLLCQFGIARSNSGQFARRLATRSVPSGPLVCAVPKRRVRSRP
jgi:hypothetical protein